MTKDQKIAATRMIDLLIEKIEKAKPGEPIRVSADEAEILGAALTKREERT